MRTLPTSQSELRTVARLLPATVWRPLPILEVAQLAELRQVVVPGAGLRASVLRRVAVWWLGRPPRAPPPPAEGEGRCAPLAASSPWPPGSACSRCLGSGSVQRCCGCKQTSDAVAARRPARVAARISGVWRSLLTRHACQQRQASGQGGCCGSWVLGVASTRSSGAVCTGAVAVGGVAGVGSSGGTASQGATVSRPARRGSGMACVEAAAGAEN